MAMTESGDDTTFLSLLALMYVLIPATAVVTTFISAPYGRHLKTGWGPPVPARLAWLVMESPALWYTAWVFLRGRFSADPAPRVLLLIYLCHYVHRVAVYPLRARLRGKTMPLTVPVLAFLYNLHNGYLQGYQIGQWHHYKLDWLSSPAFLIGLVLFLVGFSINIWADSVLFSLRTSDDDKSYRVPRGFLYELISCPNYFGESLEWAGWAAMTWSWAGLSFFLYTCANLFPRAWSHHAWYKSKFEDYPKQRRAVIPFLL